MLPLLMLYNITRLNHFDLFTWVFAPHTQTHFTSYYNASELKRMSEWVSSSAKRLIQPNFVGIIFLFFIFLCYKSTSFYVALSG